MLPKQEGWAVTVADPVRAGTVVMLPPATGQIDLCQGSLRGLQRHELEQPAWVMRFAVPYSLPAPDGDPWDMGELLAEVRFAAGGQEYTIEVDAYPSFALELAAEYVAAKLKWARTYVLAPVGVAGVAQLTRGVGATSARRSYVFETNGENTGIQNRGIVPLFAATWGIWVDEPDSVFETVNGHQLRFYDSDDGTTGRLVALYDSDSLLGLANGAPLPVPPGARSWSWSNGNSSKKFRLSFTYGAFR